MKHAALSLPLFSLLIFKVSLSKKPSPFFKAFLSRRPALPQHCSSSALFLMHENQDCLHFKFQGWHGGDEALDALFGLFVCLFVCLIIKISSYRVQTFFSFIKRDVIGGAGMECPHVPKCRTCWHLRRPGSRGSLPWLVRYLLPLLLAEVCFQEPDHLHTPKVPAPPPHGIGENGQGDFI